MKYPRVLIVNGQSIYKQNATGITLRNLWKSWDSNSLVEVVTGKRSREVPGDIRSLTASPSIIMKLSEAKGSQSINSQMKKMTGSLEAVSLRERVRQFFVCLVDVQSVGLSSEDQKEIKKFAPQVIYTLGGGVSTLRLAYKLSKTFDIPVVLHFMDNWAEHIQWEGNPLIKWYSPILRREMKKCIAQSNAVITISESMANAYEQKFGKSCYAIMNTIDQLHKVKDIVPSNSGKHFVYAGGLHLGRWMALKELAGVLLRVGQNACLDIYTSEEEIEKYLSMYTGLPVLFHKAVSHDRIWEVYDKADVLVHTESNSEALNGFFKYSISTKIPEYLASGKPILLYVPENMELYHYLDAYNAAVCASDMESLSRGIRRFNDDVYVAKLVENAQRLAKKNHLSSIAQKKLADVIEYSTNNRSIVK